MPQKNSRKIYYADAFYHVYNRGVEKRNIFRDEDDYIVFLNLLKTALWNPEKIEEEFKRNKNVTVLQGETLQRKIFHLRQNFYGRVHLLCYCLMSNHFHFLIQQKDSQALSQFVQSISTSYSMYFNKKYARVGSLFQGVFKAVDIREENYLLWLSRYIHLNPSDFENYSFSSYQEYLGKRNTEWIKKDVLIDFLPLQGETLQSRLKKYQEFVEAEKEISEDVSSIVLEED